TIRKSLPSYIFIYFYIFLYTLLHFIATPTLQLSIFVNVSLQDGLCAPGRHLALSRDNYRKSPSLTTYHSILHLVHGMSARRHSMRNQISGVSVLVEPALFD